MPWKATDELKERTKFVLEWERRWNEAEGGPVNMAELCRIFGVSRVTGYTWGERYRDQNFNLAALVERSRKPKTSPTALEPEMEDLIVAARKKYPRWGPRKLHAMLVERNPGLYVPSASVMAKVLKKRGMTAPRKRRRIKASLGIPGPFHGCDAPNDVWCIDFKGWFETGDAKRCYPLTLLDGFSRYLLRCEGMLDPDGEHVRRVLDSAFVEFGTPKVIRSDGGPPFATNGPARLSSMSAWLLRLGIEIEIIAPGKPQQNGRLERLHRTLKDDTTKPPAAELAAQQRVFDRWRGEYNHFRPHEALRMRCPADVYKRSSRAYPRPLIQPSFEPYEHVLRLDRNGFAKWKNRNVLISSALQYEHVGIEHDFEKDGRWNVYWGAIRLGYLDEHSLKRGLIFPRRPRSLREVTRMAFVEL